jgi:predicted nucleic acid-binding protein
LKNAPLLLLDSCAIVNLYASTYFESLVESLSGEVCIADYVLRESQFVRNIHHGGEDEREPIRLDDFIQRGVLRVLALDSEFEFERFLSLALRLDDGEAATLSLATTRNGTLITDDRKALSIAAEMSVPTLTTPDVLHGWAERLKLMDQEICVALENIRVRARYEPARRHPRWSWWHAVIESGHLS